MARTQKIEYLSKVWTGRLSSLIPRSELFYAGSTHMSVSLSSRLFLVQLRRELIPRLQEVLQGILLFEG